MQNIQNRSRPDYICELAPLLLTLVLIGCGRGNAGQASDNHPVKPSSAEMKSNPEAARMDLAKLGKDYSPQAFVMSAANDDKMAVQLFLAAGMDVNATGRGGMTALHAATYSGHPEMVALLLAKKAELESKNDDGLTPLMTAAMSGKASVVELILDKRPNLNAKAKDGSTAMDLAKTEEVRSALIAVGAKRLTDEAFRTMMAETWNSLERVAFNLAYNKNRQELLQMVRDEFSAQAVQGYRKQGCADFQIAQIILASNMMISKSAQASVLFDQQPPDNQKTRILQEYNALLAESWMTFETAFSHALSAGEADANFQFKDRAGNDSYTGLMIAAMRGRPELAKLLLQKGADINLSYNGKTAIDYAVAAGHTNIVVLLTNAAPKR